MKFGCHKKIGFRSVALKSDVVSSWLEAKMLPVIWQQGFYGEMWRKLERLTARAAGLLELDFLRTGLPGPLVAPAQARSPVRFLKREKVSSLRRGGCPHAKSNGLEGPALCWP